MSDFTRGWTLTSEQNGTGVAATITVPAVAGVVHVLDGFTATLVNATAANAGGDLTLSSSDGVFAAVVLARLFAAASAKDVNTGSGLDLAAGPGASLTISFGFVAAVSTVELLVVQGRDI